MAGHPIVENAYYLLYILYSKNDCQIGYGFNPLARIHIVHTTYCTYTPPGKPMKRVRCTVLYWAVLCCTVLYCEWLSEWVSEWVGVCVSEWVNEWQPNSQTGEVVKTKKPPPCIRRAENREAIILLVKISNIKSGSIINKLQVRNCLITNSGHYYWDDSTHSLIHSLTHSFTHSLTHSLTHSNAESVPISSCVVCLGSELRSWVLDCWKQFLHFLSNLKYFGILPPQ